MVVGAGPAGLVAATVLAHEGLDVLVLDKREAVSPLPRAVGISLRQMELFRSWGLEARLREGAEDVELALLRTETAASAAAGVPFEINTPSRAQSEVVSPTTSARVPQDHLEAVLLERLAQLPTAVVRRGVEVTAVVAGEDGVAVTARSTTDGEVSSVTAAYLVGADGVNSVVRRELGVAMVGPDTAMAGLSVELRAPLWDVVGEHRFALYSITHPEGAGVLIPAGGDRWQYGVVLGPDEDARRLDDHAVLRRRIRAAAGVADLPVEIVRTHAFTSGAQVAERFAQGRVLLVGDAAHRVTPRGGTGLAMAVRDGWDVGWRLAWVLQRWAPPSFLDGYELEGRPLVEDSVARAAEDTGVCRSVISEMQHDLGGRLPHVWVRPSISTLDLVGAGLTLMTTGPADRWQSAAAGCGGRGTPPVSVVPLPRHAAHALGLRGPGSAVLVRPDGVPVATWWASSDPEHDLERAVRSAATLERNPR